ncbi:M28 family peptidase [Sphingomicrobium flavum]|uniref:M28 family peptidase n=1 Tax=Sphingomicrobium flavum TaxID=1229164 RepID=UPI0021ADEA18|nr:M28 family peptidase [Sphingomicrobium flavum]
MKTVTTMSLLALTSLTAATTAIAADHHHDGHKSHGDHHANRNAMLMEAADKVSQDRLQADIDRLVAFGTRHTLSSQTDPERGIGAAVTWAMGQLEAEGLEVLRVCDMVTGDRIPEPTRVCNAVGIQRGTERPNDIIIMTGHIDSRVTDPLDFTSDAPGANDDGSGTVAVLEAARVLKGRQFPATIVYAALSGEEQGLFGGRIMAAHANAQGWNVIANLNNDIIGNSCGSDGHCEPDVVRVFSEGPRRQGFDEAMNAAQHRFGGENDAPSRNLSRYLDALADDLPAIGLDIRQIWRTDRWGRGGDHREFLAAGYPAIRFTVSVEDYDHQHQDLRTEDGTVYGDTADEMDFAYLTKVTKLNVAALAALASAPPPPSNVSATGAVSTDTTMKWQPSPGASHYHLWMRRTDGGQWEKHERFDAADCSPDGCEAMLEGIRVDDWIFGVAAVNDGHLASPTVAAVPGGQFTPIVSDED